MISDHIEIQNVISLYADRLNQRDWAGVSALFLADARWEMVGHPEYCFEGKDVGSGIQRMVEPTSFIMQISAPAVITVDAGRATSRSAVHEVVELPESRKRLQIYGVYDDALRKYNDVWRFASRRFFSQKVIETPV